MGIKLVVFDMAGTTVEDNNTRPPRTYQRIRKIAVTKLQLRMPTK